MADKFEELRNYVAIIDSGGVNAAAASIGIAKSAVSRRLGELEQRLGTTLVHRASRSFEPTAVGRRYYEGAREILAALAALDEEASSGPSTAAVRVVIRVEAPLAGAVAAAVSTLPAADGVVATIVDAGSVSDDGAAPDLSVGTATPLQADLTRLPAGALGMSVVGSPAHLDMERRPTSFGDLRSMAGIATASREGGGWHFGDEGVHAPAIALTVPDDAAALAAALAGAGLARVPAILAAIPIEEGRLEQVPLRREPAPQPVGVWIANDAAGAIRRLGDQLAKALATALS